MDKNKRLAAGEGVHVRVLTTIQLLIVTKPAGQGLNCYCSNWEV